jgi:hypothetical protein
MAELAHLCLQVLAGMVLFALALTLLYISAKVVTWGVYVARDKYIRTHKPKGY